MADRWDLRDLGRTLPPLDEEWAAFEDRRLAALDERETQELAWMRLLGWLALLAAAVALAWLGR